MKRRQFLHNIHPDPENKGDVLLGNCVSNGDIYLNVEFMWGISKSFNKFVKYFSKTFEHEVIHRLIQEELGKKKRTQVAEEHIVRKLTREQYRTWQKRFYAREDKK